MSRGAILPLLLVTPFLLLPACGGGGGGGGGGGDADPVEFVVRAIDPLNGAPNRPNSNKLTLILSKPVDPDSVGPQSFYVVEDGTSDPHPGTRKVSEDGLRVEFQPDPWFAIKSFYL